GNADTVTTQLIAIGLIALGLGALLGWLMGSRGGEQAKAAVESLRMQLDEVRNERDTNRDAARDLAALQADSRAFEQRMKDLIDSRDSLVAQFREVGDKLLTKAQEDFLDKAGERFTAADKASETKLKELLAPVETTLKRYEEGLKKVEVERIDQYAGLKAVVEQVREGQGRVRDETRNLVNALRSSPKARGRWGEKTLQNVLEQAGLVEHCDFATEVSVDTADGRLRPDAIVNLPGGRKLVIDAKCSLNAFLDAHQEVDDDRRAAHLAQHLQSMKSHVTQLGSKSYWSQFDDAAEYVVMFIPGEHFLTAALEQDHMLWEWAFERKVLLATPTNLVAIARTVSSVWRQEKLNGAAEEIANLGKELHSRLATMTQHMERVGKNLSTATTAYNQMVGSFESQVVTQARRFETLGAGSAKDLPSPAMVEIAPRPLTKIAPPPASNEDDAAA
ncbi:MAG: DNA recombination protein RmuC, partial [Sphingomicrobium sp.]